MGQHYITKSRETAVEASGKTLAEVIDAGLEYLAGLSDYTGKTGRRDTRPGGGKDDCPHPRARRSKGLCMLCGTFAGHL